MSRIASLSRDVQDAIAAVARAERTVAAHPEFPSAVVTLRSAEKRLQSVRDAFSAAIIEVGQEAISYRIEYDESHAPVIGGLTEAIGLFQKIFTTVYHSLVRGPGQRARVSAESHDATALEFAYAFPGSVGFMMTLRKKSGLFEDPIIDPAMGTTLKLLSTRNHRDLDVLSESVGLPAIRLTHKWAQENSKAGFGADIQWRLDSDMSIRARIQPEHIFELSNMLATYVAKEKISIVANLVNVNMFERTFQMEIDGKIINGYFDNAISENKKAVIPQLYLAKLTVATRVAPTEGDDGVNYFLNELLPAPSDPNFMLSTPLF